MDTSIHPVRAWRRSQLPKVTLAKLASDVGVTPSHLSEIEKGNNQPSLALAAKLSRQTGIDIAQFVKNEVAA